jgi:hypothetical protein
VRPERLGSDSKEVARFRQRYAAEISLHYRVYLGPLCDSPTPLPNKYSVRAAGV